MELHPLSKPQRSIWDMERYYGGSIANITGAAFLSEPFEMGALQAAINKTVEQNDALRIRVKIQDGIPMQYIAAYERKEYEVISFDGKDEFVLWLDELARTPFELGGELYELFIAEVNGQIGFVLHLHHLTADAWGSALLVRSVIKNLKGEPVGINSYFDHIAAEREYESSPRREKDKAHFLSCFERCGEPAYLNDRQAKKADAERICLTVGKIDTARIQAFCADNSISPYTLFMTALVTYIYRIKASREIYIGTAVINRDGRKEKETAGMFVNTVPVLFSIDEEKATLEGLRENAASILGIFRHQKYQYGDLLKDLREEYCFSARLYDVVLSFQNTAMPDDVTAQWAFCGSQAEGLNIHINDRQHEGVYHLDYTYQTELFNRRDMERLHGHLMTLISDIIENPNKKPHELKMLTDGECRQVVYGFNDTAVEYPKDKCIHQLFEEQAERSPEAVAVVFEGMEYTYRQISEMSNSLAHLLRDKGVGRNDIVAIIAKRCYKIIVAQLAILKAGGAYLPIDPNYPKERIAYMLGDAKCKAALTLGAEVDGIDMADDAIFHDNTAAIENINFSDDLCYVIYTSGSTGMPKGAMITHRNLGNFCDCNNKNNMHVTIAKKCKSFLCIGAIVFDMASAEIFLALLNNHTVIMTSDDQIENPDEVARLIDTYNVDFILTIPTRLLSLMNNDKFRKSMLKIKVLSLGGENLTTDMVEIFINSTNAVIMNGYGPTETTMGCIWAIVSDDTDITIGKPIANTQIYILDKYKNPLPIGAAGELCISGDGVGLGYLNRPELTAEKFVPNPFVEGKRMYKTGDLARWREDGNIEYIGRMDNQVKIRGLRIELGEIEAAIAKFEGIKQTAVVDRKDGGGRQYICAYYISGGAVDEKALRAHLAKTLPRYMIPHFFTRLDVFPTTPSGKTDRKSFPAPDFSQSQSSAEYAAPATEREKALVRILETVLGIAPIGTGDDFFDLGGDSLKAIEFVSKAQHEGIHIELQNIYECPTIALLAGQTSARDCQPPPYHPENLTAIHNLPAGSKVSKPAFSEPSTKRGRGGKARLSGRPLGDALITGATGWLGIHVLDEFLSREDGKAYCLTRGANEADSRNRLAAALDYYFGDKYAGCDRIIPVCGDITEEIAVNAPIGTIIHCAANVKHYGSYKYSHEVNVTGTENVIAFAKSKGARLVHISTAAVSGKDFDASPDFPPTVFDETKLYIGQPLDNVYVRSKFEAEVAVLKARLEGLDAAVIRVGNLSNRYSDMKFQRNYTENATLTRLKAFADLGLYPENVKAFPLEFSPVDCTAKAVVAIAGSFSDAHSVFHAYNQKTARFGDFAHALAAAGTEMRPIPAEQFVEAVRGMAELRDTAHIHEAFIHDIGLDGKLRFHSNITLNNDFTASYLNTLNFEWPEIDADYLTKYINYFRTIGYWDA